MVISCYSNNKNDPNRNIGLGLLRFMIPVIETYNRNGNYAYASDQSKTNKYAYAINFKLVKAENM